MNFIIIKKLLIHFMNIFKEFISSNTKRFFDNNNNNNLFLELR